MANKKLGKNENVLQIELCFQQRQIRFDTIDLRFRDFSKLRHEAVTIGRSLYQENENKHRKRIE